eukprot:COSAG03_NODE_609_length_6710_cov_20.243023_3_plen_216_part_00
MWRPSTRTATRCGRQVWDKWSTELLAVPCCHLGRLEHGRFRRSGLVCRCVPGEKHGEWSSLLCPLTVFFSLLAQRSERFVALALPKRVAILADKAAGAVLQALAGSRTSQSEMRVYAQQATHTCSLSQPLPPPPPRTKSIRSLAAVGTAPRSARCTAPCFSMRGAMAAGGRAPRRSGRRRAAGGESRRLARAPYRDGRFSCAWMTSCWRHREYHT